MKISENDISSTEPFGTIDGNQVKLVCTKGGLNLATVTDHKGQDTVLGAASHRAILCYSIEQKFPNYHQGNARRRGDRRRWEGVVHEPFPGANAGVRRRGGSDRPAYI